MWNRKKSCGCSTKIGVTNMLANKTGVPAMLNNIPSPFPMAVGEGNAIPINELYVAKPATLHSTIHTNVMCCTHSGSPGTAANTPTTPTRIAWHTKLIIREVLVFLRVSARINPAKLPITGRIIEKLKLYWRTVSLSPPFHSMKVTRVAIKTIVYVSVIEALRQ